MADERGGPVPPNEKADAEAPAPPGTTALDYPGRLRRPRRRYEDRALRPDRSRGGYDQKG